jgi:hypothetical protein
MVTAYGTGLRVCWNVATDTIIEYCSVHYDMPHCCEQNFPVDDARLWWLTFSTYQIFTIVTPYICKNLHDRIEKWKTGEKKEKKLSEWTRVERQELKSLWALLVFRWQHSCAFWLDKTIEWMWCISKNILDILFWLLSFLSFSFGIPYLLQRNSLNWNQNQHEHKIFEMFIGVL